MPLPKKALNELKAIFNDVFGKELRDQEIYEEADDLMRLAELVW